MLWKKEVIGASACSKLSVVLCVKFLTPLSKGSANRINTYTSSLLLPRKSRNMDISSSKSSLAENIKGFSFGVLDHGLEFGKAFVDTGIERPVNGIAQVVSLGHLPAIDIVQPDASAKGTRKFAQMAGSAAGVMFDFAVLNTVAGRATSSLLGAPSTALGTRLATSALAGFVSGSVLTPLKPGESQWYRLANGATQAASFVAMDGISGSLGAAFGTPTLMNSIARGGISGAGAGIVHANMDSLTRGNGFASGRQMMLEAGSWGVGGAVMGGVSYGIGKLMAGDRSIKGEKASARTADGEQAKITVSKLENGGTRIESVELPNGTRMVRQAGSNKWLNNGGTPQQQAWEGDVRLSAEGKLQYVYRFEKAPSMVTVDIKLPDGSRVAVKASDGSLILPGKTIDVTTETLSDGALSSLRKLNLDIPKERLQVQGITTGGSVNTNFSVELTAAEAAKLRTAIAAQPGTSIVTGGKEILTTAPVSASRGVLRENLPGEYVYDRPMTDHTSTVAFVFKGDDQRLKVLTGERKVAPAKGQEALPGGFVDINGKIVENPAQTAAREVLEETGLKIGKPTLLRIGDAFGRDSRNRVIDFQWGVFGNKSDLAKLLASDDLGNLQVRDLRHLLSNPRSLAFDHHQVLQEVHRNISRMIESAQSAR